MVLFAGDGPEFDEDALATDAPRAVAGERTWLRICSAACNLCSKSRKLRLQANEPRSFALGQRLTGLIIVSGVGDNWMVNRWGDLQRIHLFANDCGRPVAGW